MALNQNTATIPATGTVRLPGANFFFLIAASGNVVITLSVGGQTEIFSSAIAGLKLKRLKRWDYIDIAGAPGVTLNYLIGYTSVQADDTDIQQALATIAGTVAVAALPSVAISTPADHVLAANTADVASIPANLSRRRITIGCRAASPTLIRVSAAGLTGTGIEIQAGTFEEFDTTAALGVRNDTATAGALWYSFEET